MYLRMLLVGSLVDHRADRDARFFRIADAQTGRGREQTFHHAIVIFFENNEPRTGGTFLALITEGGVNRVDDRFVEIGVGIDDDGVLAAHLAHDALQFFLAGTRFAGAFPNAQPDFARTGERDHVDIFVIDKMRADDRALAGEEIDNARRNSGFLEHLHQHGGDDGRLFGRFHDDGVAGDERGGNHAGKNGERKIPWRDDKGDAARPIMLIAFFAGHVLRQTRAADQPHLVRVEQAEIHRFADVAVGFRPRLADFENFQRGKLEAAALHDGGDALEQLRAFFNRHAAPPNECSFRSGDGALSLPEFRRAPGNRRPGRDWSD